MTATLAVTFDAIPRSLQAGASTRMFPRVYDSSVSGSQTWLYPIISWSWSFNAGEYTSTSPTPIWTPAGGAGMYSVAVTVTDSNGNSKTTTIPDFITVAVAPTLPNDGTYFKCSVLLFDKTGHYTLINRTATSFSNLYLMTPVVTDMLDKVGQASFSLLDVGSATATENALIQAGNYVVIFMGKTILFSGVVQQCVLNTNNGFTSSTQVTMWDVTCDNDLEKLRRTNVSASALTTGGVIQDTPGNIAAKVLTPDTGIRDTRGIISRQDFPIIYNLNSAASETVGNQLEHITALQALTNYDLRARADFLVYNYTGFNGSAIFTVSGASWQTNEFVGTTAAPMFVFVCPTSLQQGISSFGKITSNTGTTNTGTTITATMTGASDAATTGTIIIYRGYLVDFAQDLSEPSPVQNYNVSQTIFDWAPNTNQRKLVTKVCAQGKDLQGVTISVALSAVHAYDVTNQQFNNTTYINNLSEGYVYQNTYIKRSALCTVQVVKTSWRNIIFTAGTSNITMSNASTYVAVGDIVNFWGNSVTLPSPFQYNADYWVIYVGGSGGSAYFRVSTSPTGQEVIPATSDSSLNCKLRNAGQLTATCEPGFLTSGDTVFFLNSDPSAGIVDDTIYYVGVTNPGATTTIFDIYTAPNDIPSKVEISSSIAPGLTMYRFRDIINPGISGSTAPYVWLVGWGYAIPSGTLMALIDRVGVTALAVTTLGAPTEITTNDGTRCTLIALTTPSSSSSKIMPSLDYSGNGYFLSSILWVKDYTKVYTSGTVTLLVGEEPISVTSTSSSTTYGQYLVCNPLLRIMSASLKAYPHGLGCFVSQMDYTEASPQALSPIATYGLVIDNVTVDSNTTYGQLDTYASGILLGQGNFYLQATANGPIVFIYLPKLGDYYEGAQASYVCPPKVGQSISCTLYSGSTPVTIQVMQVSIDVDNHMVKLILGNYLKNVYTSLIAQTNGLNQTIT